MTGLVLKLAPNERVLINGAVIQNGDKRARISIMTPNANILRLRDAIHPTKANTPLSRICYICQLILTGDADLEQAKRELARGIEQLSRAMADSDSHKIFDSATQAITIGNYYQALKQLRSLLPREARILLAAAP